MTGNNAPPRSDRRRLNLPGRDRGHLLISAVHPVQHVTGEDHVDGRGGAASSLMKTLNPARGRRFASATRLPLTVYASTIPLPEKPARSSGVLRNRRTLRKSERSQKRMRCTSGGAPSPATADTCIQGLIVGLPPFGPLTLKKSGRILRSNRNERARGLREVESVQWAVGPRVSGVRDAAPNVCSINFKMLPYSYWVWRRAALTYGEITSIGVRMPRPA